jgi:hypothetical protein
MRQTPLLAALVLLASPAVRAETIEASSTTFLTIGKDTRYHGGTKPDLVTVAPAFEILSITARDMEAGFADDVQAVLSTWASVDLAERRWDNGTASSSFTGDVTTGYVQGRMLDRHLTLRVGRSMVPNGIARMLQIDGGYALVDVPAGPLLVKVSSYVGSPTSQRFTDRSGDKSWNPQGGTLAYGGRVAAALPLTGWPGRGLELGGSFNEVDDHSHIARQEVGGDLRLQPFAGNDLALAGFTSLSLPENRVSEASAALSASATRKLHLTADWRYAEPSLLLSRYSILSVFSASTWNEFGGGARYQLGHGLTAGLDAHLRIEPGETSGTHTGTDLAGTLDGAFGKTTAGLEVSYLDAATNGYTALRVYARRELGRAFVAADVMPQFFRKDINAHSSAVTGTLSGGLNLAHGFSAVLAGGAGMTPYLEQSYELFVKLAYNQTYRVEEVR